MVIWADEHVCPHLGFFFNPFLSLPDLTSLFHLLLCDLVSQWLKCVFILSAPSIPHTLLFLLFLSKSGGRGTWITVHPFQHCLYRCLTRQTLGLLGC